MTTATETMNVSEAQQQLAIAEDSLTEHNEILRAIQFHEMQILSLRATLKPTVKMFFHFRCNPEKHVFVYANSREQADERLRTRMEDSYPPHRGGWGMASPVVKVYDDPQLAIAAAPCNLLSCLSPAEAREFIEDYREDKRLRDDKEKLKHLPKSQLERDIENYEIRQRMMEN